MAHRTASKAIQGFEARVELHGRRRKQVTVGLTVGIFVSALEMTVVAAAMPTVVSSLGGLPLYSWVFSAFMLASTVTLPMWGKLSDLYGRKVFYLLGIALFLTGSVLAGQSQTMHQLIAFRVLQGLGAGALTPIGMTIAAEIYSLEERAKKQAVFSSAWGIASVLGPMVGGFVTEHLSWRWVFYLGVPFGVTAAILVGTSLPRSRSTDVPVKIDYAGALTLTCASLCFLLLVSGQASAASFLGLFDPLLGVLFFLSLILFLWVERRISDPILPTDLFGQRATGLSMLLGFCTGMAMLGSIAFIPLFVQGAMGASPSLAGGSLMPVFVFWVIFSVISSRILLRVGFRALIITGALTLVIGFLSLSQIPEPASYQRVIGSLALIGAGMGLSNVTILLLVQHCVPRGQLGSATASLIFLRSLGGAVGVSIMGAVTNVRLHSSPQLGEELVRAHIGQPLLERFMAHPDIIVHSSIRETLSPPALGLFRQLLGHAISGAFLTGMVIVAVALFVSLFLPKVPSVKSYDRSSADLVA